MNRPSTTFEVDGHEVTATFAEQRNPEAWNRIKQILLSAFSNSANLRSTENDLEKPGIPEYNGRVRKSFAP